MKVDTVIILAAGRGIRMMPISKTIPKPMIKINGKSLIERGISILKKKFNNIYITVGYKSSKLSAHVISKGVTGIFNTEGQGNGWWIYNTLLSNLNKPVLVLTCDNLFKLNYKFLVEEYVRLKKPACLIFPVQPVKNCAGDFVHFKNSKVIKLSRKKKTNFYASGIQILNPKKISKITKKTFSFNNVWMQLIKKNKLFVSKLYPGKWYAIDNLKNLDHIKKNSKIRNYFFK